MPFIQKSNYISGDLLVEGTVEAQHIKTNTITANKFSGAVEEENWAYLDDKDVGFSYSTYSSVIEFTHPATDLDLFKGRHVSYFGEAYMNTSTGTQYDGFLHFRLEAEVPEVQTATFIGNATHRTSSSGYQIVTLMAI